jgi:hypothetical protein
MPGKILVERMILVQAERVAWQPLQPRGIDMRSHVEAMQGIRFKTSKIVVQAETAWRVLRKTTQVVTKPMPKTKVGRHTKQAWS